MAMGGIQDWEPGMGADSQASRRGEDLESKRKKKRKELGSRADCDDHG